MSDCSTNAWRVPESEHGVTLNSYQARIFITSAARYYMGRHTIAVHGFCNDLIELLPELDEDTKSILERDVSMWLELNPTCMFGTIDDAEPWRRLLGALRDDAS